MDRYDTIRKKMENAFCDLAILAGDVVDTYSAGWQNVAGTASVNLRSLANALDSLRQGETHHQGCPWSGPTVFPSPMEVCEKVYGENEEAE